MNALTNPLRPVAVALVLTYTFIQFTKLHEVITMVLGFNSYILNIVGIPALVFTLLVGGLGRTFGCAAGRWWLLFVGFLVAAVPFSTWIAQSLTLVTNFLRSDFTLVLLLGGVLLTVRDLQKLAHVMALAAAVDAVVGLLFVKTGSDNRVFLEAGTMQDPNDYAAQLLLVTPFLLYVVLHPRRNGLVRAGAGIMVLVALYSMLQTGSRGGLIGAMVGLLFCLVKIRPVQRLALIAVIVVAAVGYAILLPGHTTARFSGMFTAADSDASMLSRRELLIRSIEVTIAHPLLGVGPGQFSNYEGLSSRKEGHQGLWHETHNSYTQVSSEVGVPGALCFGAAVLTSFLLMNRSYRAVSRLTQTEENAEITRISFYAILSAVSFCTAIAFLSLAYRLYLPALTGIAISLWRITSHQMMISPPATAGRTGPLTLQDVTARLNL